MAEQKKQDTNQLLKVRREKLADLQANGKDPFQITKFDQTHHSLEVKNLYEAHEAEILKDHKTPDVEGLDEAQVREVLKQDYEERRKRWNRCRTLITPPCTSRMRTLSVTLTDTA